MVCSPHNYVVQGIAAGVDYASIRAIVGDELRKQTAVYQLAPQRSALYSAGLEENKLPQRLYTATPNDNQQPLYNTLQRPNQMELQRENLLFSPQLPTKEEFPSLLEPASAEYFSTILKYAPLVAANQDVEENSETRKIRDDLVKKIREELALLNRQPRTTIQKRSVTAPREMRLYN